VKFRKVLKRKRVYFQKLFDNKISSDLSFNLEILNWMLATGMSYEKQSNWDRYGVDKLMFDYSHNNTDSHTNLLDIICDNTEMIKFYFINAVIKKPPIQLLEQWRTDYNIFLGKYKLIPIETQIPGKVDINITKNIGGRVGVVWFLRQGLSSLREFIGSDTDKELSGWQTDFPERVNEYIKNIKFSTAGYGYHIDIHYSYKMVGYEHNEWIKEFNQNQDESIDMFVYRVLVLLDKITI